MTDGPGRRSRRAWLGLAVAATLLAALWFGRRPVLVALGRALVVEDPLAPVDLLVVSNAAARADAIEGARLYREGISPRLAVAEWRVDPAVAEIRCLGIPLLDPTALSRAILERSGVPASAITVLPGQAEGTEDEVAAIVAYVRANERLQSVLVLVPRTHGARVRWLLHRHLRPTVRVAVRGAPYDLFSPDDWWRSREASREVMEEYLRWINTTILGDAWSRNPASLPGPSATCTCCAAGPAAGE